MRKNLPNLALFVALAAGLTAFWYFYLDKKLRPEPPTPDPDAALKKLTNRELAYTAAAGAAFASTEPRHFKPAAKPAAGPAAPPAPEKPSEPHVLVRLGDDSFYKQVLLNSRGAAVQQVVLPGFPEATRLGLEAKDEAGKTRPLYLIPGFDRPMGKYLKDEPPYFDLEPGAVSDRTRTVLSEPSYVLLHYPDKTDPEWTRAEDERFPLPTLGTRTWKLVGQKPYDPATDAPAEAVFETEVDAPYSLRVRKTYQLRPKEYHLTLKLDFEALPGRQPGKGVFRYQIVGGRGLPVEGEWYTSTFRNVMVGWMDRTVAKREFEDAASVNLKHGGDEVVRVGQEFRFRYAAVATQYFASAIAVDGGAGADEQPWERVRPTREARVLETSGREANTEYTEKPTLYDVTVRVVSVPVNPEPGKPVTHRYLVYNGPVKVRLLKQLRGERDIDEALVERYARDYSLETMTDYHSPSWFGRRLNSIYWSDLVIATTNLMHWLLGLLFRAVGSLGVSIILLTILVKLLLLIPSRRQQMITKDMTDKIGKIKPELDKLQEKYREDFMTLQQEKAKLFRRAGISQTAQLRGCLLLFAQAPILGGLYFALQESIFFRLTPFGWMPNLAAPDMLFWWGEGIPLISTPSARFNSFVYLGPYFNLLPVLSVALFFVQQKLTMPPPTDDLQRKNMKIAQASLIFAAFFFYKVAAGLCLYFIVSGLWSLFERLVLMPKPKPAAAGPAALPEPEPKAVATSKLPAGDGEPKPGGFLTRMRAKMEELQQQADTTRQIRNQPNQPAPPPRPSAADRAQERRKKRKR